MIPRLSSPLDQLKAQYDVVVVGSGYGGGIAASRLARAGRSVCLLERGEERLPGEFPDTLPEAAENMQMQTREATIGSPTGMFNFHVHPDMNVLVGCGLGGTSLINANVALRPDPRVFDDPRWPQALRDDLQAGFSAGLDRAEEMLRPMTYPDSFPPLPKLEAQRRAAGTMGQPFMKTAINVTFADGVNHVGVEQKACILCGDCVSGCNHGAKNTTQMNYLPDAHNHGAEIFTGARVKYVERSGAEWVVYFEPIGAGREQFKAPLLMVRADVVVLAAGTLGSTEILLRSRAQGLATSDRLGERFSGNGDVLAFAFATRDEIDGIGFGNKPAGSVPNVGPCITSVIDLRGTAKVDDGLIIEEGSIPGALGPMLAAPFSSLANESVAASGQVNLDRFARRARLEIETLVRGPHAGALAHTQTFLVMGHDDANGRLSLDNDRLRIDWPGVGTQPAIRQANERLAEVAAALGGIYIKNPVWSDLMKHSLVTVHPLGGCVMGEAAETGVVNHKGEVFAGPAGTAVHEGLYVSDGSVIPLALGVNPLITISGLAERSMAQLAKDRGWTIDYALPSKPVRPAVPARLGLQFTEKMAGFISTAVTDDFDRAAKRGKQDGSPCEFVLTIVSDDLETMLADPTHEAAIFGTVSAPAISPEPMTVDRGVFNLFVEDPSQASTRRMRYRMQLHTADGRALHFDGFKTIEPGSLLKIWPATTTLYVTVRDGDSEAAAVLGKGVLLIRPLDFAAQMTTMKINNAPTLAARVRALAQFGELFAGVLWRTYGGALAVLADSGAPANTPAHKPRPLRAPDREAHFFAADDGAELRLVRFKGGTKGPIIVAPGFSNSTYVFTFDGIDPNFAEFFAAHGYDVWLFDYRASPDLPVSRTQFTLDDIARRDWPAAVEYVRTATGATDVQIVAHCMGSMTCFMALLSGLTGVRQFVSSQLTAHVDAEVADKVKAGIHLDAALRLMGVKGLDTGDATTPEMETIDRLLALYPMPDEWRALGGVGRRIFAVYGHVLKPQNLNQATADALGQMFGFGNVRAFSQIVEILRQGHIVDQHGADGYLPHVDRLKLPISIIHGADNVFVFPKGSEMTYDWLRSNNGDAFYTRHVVPGYAHLDCFIGANAGEGVLPVVLAELEKGN